MKRISGKTCAIMIVALSFGLSGAVQDANRRKKSMTRCRPT